jgi:hypothetical protein
VRQVAKCNPTPPAARDNITGWFIYFCGGGTLLVPSARCVGPECTGAAPGKTLNLGYAGDLDAGSRGSFATAGSLVGLCATDGVELAQGLAQIDALRREGQIDRYYAGAARNAYANAERGPCDRPAPFVAPSPLGAPLAPGALARAYRGVSGEDVGQSVDQACRCTPRPFDARDPISGWGIYYVKGGVLLTPSEKCIDSGGKPESLWATTWRNVKALLPAPPQPPPLPVAAPPAPAPAPVAPAQPPPPPPKPPTTICYDPRIWPPLFRDLGRPCVAPEIPYPG